MQSQEAELALEKGLMFLQTHSNDHCPRLSMTTKFFQSVSTFDAEVHEELQEEANELLKGHIQGNVR